MWLQNSFMKKILFLLVGIVLLCHNSRAQFNEKPVMNLETEDLHPLNWGYFLGFNQYDFKFDYKQPPSSIDEVQVAKSIGFSVGLIGEMRINEFLDLRFEPGLSYTQRDLGFIDMNEIREVKSTYIHFPLLLKMSARRIGNWKPYLVGGVSTSMNLGSNEDSVDDNSSGTFRMKKNTYYYEMGFGIDFYTEYFKFSPSIRGVFGLSDELVRDNDPNSPWTGNIESMKTRGLFVVFTFE